ncbi:MAG: hypothetical protein ACP6IT_05835 [Candidatus Thorarchaeota archaeon]
MTKLEYLMVYTQSGLPIYSKCFGGFCKSAFESPELLAGLLSAIETIPPTLSEGSRAAPDNLDNLGHRRPRHPMT